jgi:hypothetical protein
MGFGGVGGRLWLDSGLCRVTWRNFKEGYDFLIICENLDYVDSSELSHGKKK